MTSYEKAREPEDRLCKNPCLVSHEAKPERKNLHLFTNRCIMDEETNRHDQDITSVGQEEDLLTVDDDENPEIDAGEESLMAMMIKMNNNMNSVLTRLSRVEAAQGKPAAKKRRIAAVTDTVDDDNNLSEAERAISDSELLTDGTADGEAPNVSNTSAAEDEILSEIAQDYVEGAQTSADVSQKLAEIVNTRWSSKLDESKLKDKMSKYDRPNNCEKLTVPRINPEIWSTLNHTARGSELPENAGCGWSCPNSIDRSTVVYPS